jgi:short-subunit dehydrogenase
MKSMITQQPISEKVIVITGASSGVGRAATLAFAAEGATLILAARRTKMIEQLVQECEELGAKALAVTTNVADADQVKTLAKQAIDFAGKIDVWLNNAGVLAAGPFDDTPIEIHKGVIETNLLGYINGAHAVLPYFKGQGFGVLINNISVGAWLATPYAAGYTASKFGLLGFAESLRGELIGWKQIHVCNLFPAFLDTPGIQHAANYSGKVLRPAPPVYSPQRVALAMVKLAQYPKPSTTTDLFAPALKTAYSLFPGLTLATTAKVIRQYFDHADEISSTNGNVLSPLEFGSSISGGWQSMLKGKAKPIMNNAALIVAGLSVGLLLLARR